MRPALLIGSIRCVIATMKSMRFILRCFRELLTYMMEDPRNITACTHLLFCAKNLERVGDHATNIAETVFYIVTGNQMAADRPTDDSSHELTAERSYEMASGHCSQRALHPRIGVVEDEDALGGAAAL